MNLSNQMRIRAEERRPIISLRKGLVRLFCLILIGHFAMARMAFSYDDPAKKKAPQFDTAESCASCHSKQYGEWKGSMMHYGAQSPVFQAFELTVRKLTGRFGPHDGVDPTLCINCHAPISAYQNDMAGVTRNGASLDAMSFTGSEGVSCTFCHSVRGIKDRLDLPKGALGDGIGNALVVFWPTPKLNGPTISPPDKPPTPSSYHGQGFMNNKKASEYLKSSQFCGACHDVRLPHSPDQGTGQPFQREQDTFTEWKNGPYNSKNNPYGETVSCQDCHMSRYGMKNPATGMPFPPKSYPEVFIAQGAAEKRKHALHAFTAASTSLLGPSDTFPNQDNPSVDESGFPRGQKQIREQMLKAACKMSLGATPTSWNGTGPLPVTVTVTNVGAGHRVPTGFSQEREMWIELTVSDELGAPLYQSGYLRDEAHPETGEVKPDGNLNDEALNDVRYVIDPLTFEVKRRRMGPDLNLRPFREAGLALFTNAFLKKSGNGYEKIAAFFLPTQMDNERSLPMLQPVDVRYEIPIVSYLISHASNPGSLRVKARLRYRTFPPKTLRALAMREPRFVTEAVIDRNEIVTMAEADTLVALSKPSASLEKESSYASAEAYRFRKGSVDWISFFNPTYYVNAELACQKNDCELPTVLEMDSLGFGIYKPRLSDNKDELFKERWTRDFAGSDGVARKQVTYTFARNQERLATARSDRASLDRKYFMCICTGKVAGGDHGVR